MPLLLLFAKVSRPRRPSSPAPSYLPARPINPYPCARAHRCACSPRPRQHTHVPTHQRHDTHKTRHMHTHVVEPFSTGGRSPMTSRTVTVRSGAPAAGGPLAWKNWPEGAATGWGVCGYGQVVQEVDGEMLRCAFVWRIEHTPSVHLGTNALCTSQGRCDVHVRDTVLRYRHAPSQ